MTTPTFDQLHNWKQQLVEDSVAWARDVKHVDGERLEAYKAGLEQGAAKMLACLRLHGVLPSGEADRCRNATTQPYHPTRNGL